jgi:hypothetical protein
LLVQAGKQLEHLSGGLIKAGLHEVVVSQATVEVCVSPTGKIEMICLLYIYKHSPQTIEKRKTQYPERPLIRISSTFFWHLSSDYDLVPVPSLSSRAHAIHADQTNLGKDDEEESTYEPMKVGQQVQK